ncbi:uncharacterized protein LOC127872267 [Dreissena polymorpha]|uniref:uncharacterized protein LOC127872267 n=1 Tax=Dreissena polymorpha TaxID=45954 RepID=UPI0022644AF5|nr:uncharacterized protein LOC127872267 [Dreissena polymorpha]
MASREDLLTFKQAMKASRKKGGTVNQRLSNILLAYRTSPHSTTNETPAVLFMGRAFQTRLSLIKPNVEKRVLREQEKMFANSKRPARTFMNGKQVCVYHSSSSSNKWTSGSIVSQSGPLSYKVDVSLGTLWRRHTDKISCGTLPVSDQSPEVPVALPPNTVPEAAAINDSVSPHHDQPTPAPPAPAPDKTTAAPRRYRRYPVRASRDKPPDWLDL